MLSCGADGVMGSGMSFASSPLSFRSLAPDLLSRLDPAPACPQPGAALLDLPEECREGEMRLTCRQTSQLSTAAHCGLWVLPLEVAPLTGNCSHCPCPCPASRLRKVSYYTLLTQEESRVQNKAVVTRYCCPRNTAKLKPGLFVPLLGRSRSPQVLPP